MRILLINPPHTAIGSRIPHEHLPPLGLLSIGGALIDAGHSVELLDADIDPLSQKSIVAHVADQRPDAVFLGHSGSTSAHPVIAEITRAIKASSPTVKIVYGGVFPTYSWDSILTYEPQIDVIVRGEGEATAVHVADALALQTPLSDIPQIAFIQDGVPTATAEEPPPVDLDSFRVGWELIDHSRYSYWGDRRAVVIQFSRGCPHACSYCGQHGFWKQWRHRDPVLFAREIAMLYRQHGVEVFNLADENPTASQSAWHAFLEALIAEDVPVILVGSTRADDIVRDVDILHLYKKAGVQRFLLGIENYDENTLQKICKGGTPDKDREAIQLLRKHNILSMATYVVGFEEERDRDYFNGLRKLLAYDPDQIQLLYVSPHHWTPFAAEEADRSVLQMDLRKWDYKHQVLTTRHVPAWRVLLWVKLIEVIMQGRPKALKRYITHPDRSILAATRWYYRIGRKVWPYEIWCFAFRDKHQKHGPPLATFQASAALPPSHGHQRSADLSLIHNRYADAAGSWDALNV
jgi:anaerobic magnesium-protoporphyrin IX monomethyl ester cyclase